MPSLNHTWKKDKEYKPFSIQYVYAQYECTRCGCVKYKIAFKRFGKTIHEERFERSNMDFDYNPECINWEDNTLD